MTKTTSKRIQEKLYLQDPDTTKRLIYMDKKINLYTKLD